MKKLFLLIALALTMSVGYTMAEEPTVYTSGDFQYVLKEDGTAEITDYTGKDEDLEIPSILEKYTVTTIGDEAFSYRDHLSSITIPDTIIALGANPFRSCDNLTSIKVSPDHSTLATIDGVLFDKTEKKLISYPCSYTSTQYVIPQGIRAIGDYAFSDCYYLTSITIPDSVTTIGNSAFYFCKSLTSITIPNSVISIDDEAFFHCTALTNVTIPDSVISIGENPFRSCTNLTSINVSPDHPALATINGVLFDKTQKKLICYPCAYTAYQYEIPQGIRSIGGESFIGCSTLINVTIPNSVTIIGHHAFTTCKNLTNITIPNSVITIDDYAFTFCSSLTSVTIPDSIITIGKGAFSRCSALTSVIIPDSVTSIGENAFNHCADTLVLTVPRNSYAAQWAKENNVPYTYPDANDWLLN